MFFCYAFEIYRWSGVDDFIFSDFNDLSKYCYIEDANISLNSACGERIDSALH